MLVADLIGIAILFLAIYFVGRPMLRGAIYFPTTSRGVDEMMRLAGIRAGETVVDIGSGDGRVLIAAAQLGATSIGYEINPWLVWRSRRAITQAAVADRATVHWKSLWDADLSRCDVVIVYGIPYIMNGLRKKFERELRPGTRILSNAFEIPGWTPDASERKIIRYVFLSKEER